MELLEGALLAALAAAAFGACALLSWLCAPVRDARRLAQRPDAAQERAFEDPRAAEPRCC